MIIDSKYAKELYTMPDRSIYGQHWINHFATDLYQQYRPFIKGAVADFGCNFGWWSARVSQFEEVDSVAGYDINEESIGHANTTILAEIPETRHKVKFTACNLLEIPEKDEVFDFGFSCHVLEHIFPEDVSKFMDELTRTVKKGGYFLMNIPCKNSLPWETTHVYHPDLEEMNGLFTSRGFATVESYEKPIREWSGPSLNMTGLYKKLSDLDW